MPLPQPGPHLTAYLGGGKSEAGLSVGSIIEAGTGEEEGEREPGGSVSPSLQHGTSHLTWGVRALGCRAVLLLLVLVWLRQQSRGGRLQVQAPVHHRAAWGQEDSRYLHHLHLQYLHYSIYSIYTYSIYSIYPPAVEAERVWSCQAGGGVTGAAHQLIYHKPRARTRYSKEVEDVGCWHCSGVTELRPGELSQLSGPGSAAVLWPLVVHCSTGATGATTATLRLRHSSPRLS